MQAFNCRFWVQVIAKDGSDVGEIDVALPFVPYPGLRVVGLDAPLQEDEGNLVETVCYLMKEEVFLCWVGNDVCRDETVSEAKRIYGPLWKWEKGS